MTDRAPDNMPTETIQRFITDAEKQQKEWSSACTRYSQQLKTAIGQVGYYTEKVDEYKGWLEQRLDQGGSEKPSDPLRSAHTAYAKEHYFKTPKAGN